MNGGDLLFSTAYARKSNVPHVTELMIETEVDIGTPGNEARRRTLGR